MRSFRLSAAFAAALLGGAALLLAPNVGAQPASATGKGIVGGALLGSEAVLITEAVLRVKPRWAYWLGGALGALAGAAGGYFIERSDDAQLAMILLASGTALSIPTSAIVLDATVYREPQDSMRDKQAHSLLFVESNRGQVAGRWSVPAVAVAQVYSKEELSTLGLRQRTGVRIPLFSMVF